MRKILSLFVVLLCAINSRAADYIDFLTTDRGFTEVTTFDDILTGDYYYVIGSAEDTEMIVSVGRYEAKPGWAPEQTLAMRYKSTATDPVLDPKNYFIIEKQDSYIGLRSLPYSICMFQTNDGQGYMWVNGFLYEHNMSEWDQLAPTFENGYWIFKNQKFASDDYHLGPWNKVVADDEPIAGNRLNVEGDEAGHYRLFRISKTDYESNIKQVRLDAMIEATPSAPVDATWMIKNPTFDQGFTGWNISRGNPDTEATLEDLFENGGWHTNVDGTDVDWGDTYVANYDMTNKDGAYLYNSWCWWATSQNIYQTLTDVPDGRYELSAVLCSHENRTVTLYGNDIQKSVTTTGAGNGIPTSLQVVVNGGTLLVKAGTTVDWWSEDGVPYTEERTIGFFKVDNFQLKCLGVYLGAVAQPLPNDETTMLTADQWYYYDAPADGKYTLTGNLMGMVYTDEDETPLPEISENLTKNEMGFNRGRMYFKTTRSDATLKVEPAMDINTFTACALNVDGLPGSISLISINPDGPGSDGTKLISSYLNNKGYDLIGFSEDFNYHSELTSNMSDYNWGYHRGSVSGLSNNTDGLEYATKSSVATFNPYPETTNNKSWTAFNTSEGGASSGGNTMINKGYRYYETTIDGVTIDVFITHMDADGSGDNNHISSRNAQWTELANAIKAKDNGRPKIFMGDTNSRWTREDIKANFVDALSDTYDVQDTWVEMCRGGNYDGLVDESGYGWGIVNDSDPSKFSAYEVVDKIFYLNPKADNTYRLTPQSWKLELDYVDGDGNQLGDHKPVVVDFAIAYNESVDNTVTPGDIVAGDGANMTDLEALVEILKGNILGTYDVNAADLNGDGEITLSDLTTLVNMLLPSNQE